MDVLSRSPLRNYINGQWQPAQTTDELPVYNPATATVLNRVPLSPRQDVETAVRAAATAFQDWRRVPAPQRIQPLFQLRQLLTDNLDELCRLITLECGKTLAEARGEWQRALENVEVACGIPMLMQGNNLEDVARGIDEMTFRQPLGVCAIITPFNFPGMIPFWFLPYAIACGNTVIIKPSEKVPLTMQQVTRLIAATDLPPGVVNLVNGAKTVVETLLEHPTVKSISFVGSSPVAQHIYTQAAAHGKRVQCQGGAKNPLIVLPDADPKLTTRIAADSAFGCAGQRCLAASVAVTVGQAQSWFPEAIAQAASERVVGNGLDPEVQMGPVISAQSRARIEGLIQKGLDEGGRASVDGRNPRIPGGERGHFLRPTVLTGLPSDGELARTEIFGPVLGLTHVETIEDAIALVNRSPWGNMACLFTRSGAAARQFRSEAEAGNIGINIGVAAPMAYFPFSGWKASFFGDLHGQGRHAVEFFTQTKVVVERWFDAWTRQF
ncbi:MAG: CoA-acylating methylmalonate-semialdehyde dehydrogenase [Spirulinaceae cyanobacterium SM2_1_0]|nr:CoA-acylating methylmalonate-semialdehyde dehydrogenase [Spirulinaceae cyanobacterium SM2_1_0]